MDFDYKNYSLRNLENWLHDAISSAEASPQEIYDTIKNVIREEYYYYKNNTANLYELLSLLNGNKPSMSTVEKTYDEMVAEGNEMTADGFWIPSQKENDKVVKWQLPVEVDGASGEYYIQFPDDLMEAAGIKEDDLVEWIDRGNGSFELRKVNGTK
jgi:SOS-response transcriptional repressor LexA